MIFMFPNPINRGLSLTKVIGGMSKTLNVVNQLIPLYKEAKPMITNAQSAFKVAKEFMKVDNKENTGKVKQTLQKIDTKKTSSSLTASNRPVFFV